MTKSRLLLGFIAMLALGASIASADVSTFTLTTGNTALTGGTPSFTGPYATVTVNQTSTTTATVTFDSLTQTISGTTYLYMLGDGGSVGMNVKGTFSLGAVTGSNSQPGFTPGPYVNGGAANEDGFGVFNQTIDSFDGYTHSSTEIVVNLTATGSNTWSNAAGVLASNAPAAAHIFVCAESGGNCSTTSGAVVTGFAAGVGSGGTFSSFGGVPEPTSVFLLGSVLCGVAGICRKKARRQKA